LDITSLSSVREKYSCRSEPPLLSVPIPVSLSVYGRVGEQKESSNLLSTLCERSSIGGVHCVDKEGATLVHAIRDDLIADIDVINR
jgi:hypothetical protein